MKINYSYSLSTLSNKLIGSKFVCLAFMKGTFTKEEDVLVFSGIHEFLIDFYSDETKSYLTYIVKSEGTESIGGNLFGFGFAEWEGSRRFDEKGYNVSFLLDDMTSKVKSIVGYGVKENVVIDDEKLLDIWYRNSGSIPEKVEIQRNTLDIIAIELEGFQWTYLCSKGKGYYTVFFNNNLEPAIFIKTNHVDELIEIERI